MIIVIYQCCFPYFAGVYGSFSVHGMSPSVYWSHLSETVYSGATSITLQDAVDWSVGSKILVATTSFDTTETEIVEISAVSDDGLTISLTTPLEHHHIGMYTNIILLSSR